MTEPLRALFLSVGVRGEAQSIGALTRIHAASEALKTSFLETAQAVRGLQTSLTGFNRITDASSRMSSAVPTIDRYAGAMNRAAAANTAMSFAEMKSAQAMRVSRLSEAAATTRLGTVFTPTQGTRTAADIARVNRLLAASETSGARLGTRFGFQDLPGAAQPPSRGGGGRGSDAGFFGLGTSLFVGYQLASIARATFSEAARQEQAAVRASFASEGLLSPSQVRDLAASSSARFGLRQSQMAVLQQRVAQLGIGDVKAQAALSDTAAALQKATGEIDAGAAAADVYRLIRLTGPGATLNQRLSRAKDVGDLLVAAGNISAAGIPDVLQFATQIAQTGIVSDLSTKDSIALAAAFSDINQKNPRTIQNALTRIFVGKSDEELNKFIPGYAGLSSAERLKAIVARVGEETTTAGKTKLIGSIFGNTRDITTIAELSAAIDKLSKVQAFQPDGSLDRLVDAIRNTLGGRWDDFTAALSRLAVSITTVLGPVLKATLAVVTKVTSTVAGNPILAGITGVGLSALAIRIVTGMFGRLLGRGGGGGVLGGIFRGGAGGAAVSSGGGLLSRLFARGASVAPGVVGGAAGATAGPLARLIGRGAGARLTSGLLGRVVGRSAFSAIPIAGQVALAASMLEDPLRSMGAKSFAFGDPSKEGHMGGLAGGGALLAGGALNLLGSAGGVINKLFDGIGSLIGKLITGTDKESKQTPTNAFPTQEINVNVGNNPQAAFQISMDQAARRSAYYIPSPLYEGI